MKLVEAKIVENSKEDPASEPDQDPNTWLIEAKLSEDVIDWETLRLDFRISEIESEIVESRQATVLNGSWRSWWWSKKGARRCPWTCS
jgi:hypothetical protein